MKSKLLTLLICCFGIQFLSAQTKAPENWFNLDQRADNVHGVSTEKAYKQNLKDMKSQTVIVAVIDSGIDTEHEDLRDVMWVNTDEIPGNGIDDDNNGYIDDIHGWNFIGGKNGNVDQDTYEVTRLYGKYKKKYENAAESSLSKKEKKEYAIYKKCKEEVESQLKDAEAQVAQMDATETMLMGALDELGKALDGKAITPESIEALDAADNQNLAIAKRIINRVFEGGDEVESIDAVKEDIMGQIEEGKEYYSGKLKYAYNTDFNPRTIVGDDYNNPYEKGYGNNEYEGPDAFHGTHVAGIIGAIRGNGIGMDGVADNVRIMSLRAVPNGDERDKDVANAIIYAVDNGARVINMSFGKGFSWNKQVVDKAVKYAKKKDVLLVHAAGNSSQDNDISDNFPTDFPAKKNGKLKKKAYPNWLEVGALSWKSGEDAPATFSNYGKKQVDLFAPGVAIYSTTPDNNYRNAQGTSMASPVVAGVAAVLMSYFPNLTAVQVKDILMSSTVKNSQKVKLPGGDGELTPFSELSVSGGVINVVTAVKKAKGVKGKRKVKTVSLNKA